MSTGNGTPPRPPGPGPDEAAAADRRFATTLLVWLLFCGLLGAALLIFSIWVDWR